MILQISDWRFNRSLWQDELATALNLRDRSYSQLTRPLDWEQVAPIGFLWTSKLFEKFGGESEKVLRLFPLICGIAGLWLAWAWLKEFLNPLETALAMGLLVIQPRWVEFSAELKPYSADVAMTLLILLIEARARRSNFNARSIAALAIVGAVAPWFSFPAILVMAAILLCEGAILLSRRRWKALLMLAAAFLLFLVSAAAELHLLRPAFHDSYLRTFWREDLSNGSVAAIFRLFGNPWKGTVEPLAAGMAAAGLVILILRKNFVGMIFLAMIGAAVTAAATGKYPLGDRLALYLMPPIAVTIAAAVGAIGKLPWKWMGIAAGVIYLISLGDPAIRSAANLFQPGGREESRPVLAQLAARNRAGDQLYVYERSQCAVLFYGPKLGVRLTPVMGENIDPDLDGRLLPLLRRGRTWVFFAHGMRVNDSDVHADFVAWCDARAHRMDTIEAPGSAAYQYEPLETTGDNSK